MTGDEARRVVEQAQHLRDLQSHHGWRSLIAYVEEHANARRQTILGGGCKDIDEYRKQTGWLEGAKFVLEAAEKSEASACIARAVLNKGA